MTQKPPPDDTARAAKVAAVLGAIFTLGGLGLYGWKVAFSIFIGAAIAVANLLTMRAIIRAMVQAPEDDEAGTERPDVDHKDAGRRGGAAWGVFAVLKILVLFGGIWILLTRNLVDPMPLVVGYGVLPLGIAASSLLANLGPRR